MGGCIINRIGWTGASLPPSYGAGSLLLLDETTTKTRGAGNRLAPAPRGRNFPVLLDLELPDLGDIEGVAREALGSYGAAQEGDGVDAP